jgi:hypothetical protein
MKPPTRKLNTTEDGQIACAFGTPWLDHFIDRAVVVADAVTLRLRVAPPKGCPACAAKTKELAGD